MLPVSVLNGGGPYFIGELVFTNAEDEQGESCNVDQLGWIVLARLALGDEDAYNWGNVNNLFVLKVCINENWIIKFLYLSVDYDILARGMWCCIM